MDFQIEEDFLGNLLLKPDLVATVVISDTCFFDNINKFIFNLILKQYSDHKTVNISAMVENYKHCFNEKYQIKKIVEKMTLFISNSFLINNFDYYQETLFERYIRQMILEEINNFKNNKISSEEMLKNIHKYESITIKTNENRLNENQIYELISSNNQDITFRFKRLSDVANIQEHDFVIIGARPGTGKSAFLLNLMEDLSNSYSCIFFNMEMADKQTYQRLVSINTKIPMKYHTNPATEYQLNLIKEGCKNISNKKIKIYRQSQTISTIRKKIVREAKNNHVIVFIDYIGLIGGKERNQSLYEHITTVAKELRQISLDYDCTIISAAQLNRNPAKEDKMPKVSDLRESGELEQSSTTVLMLYDENSDKNLSKSEVEMTIIIGKNRNGKVALTKLNYNKEIQRFDDIKEKKYLNNNEWRIE